MHDMRGKISIVIFLFLFVFGTAKSLIYKHLEGKCEFNYTSGNWDEFSESVPILHACIQRFKHCELLVHMNNYSLPAFPNATFLNLDRNLTLKLVIDHSRIQLLSPSLPDYSIFQNSLFHSVVIDVSDSATLIGWNWIALQNLTLAPGSGLVLNVVRTKLVYLHSDFSKIAKGRVVEVRILKCGLRWLGRKVFASHVYLKTLELRDNLLADIQRSQLPSYAPKLNVLDLGNNQLGFLPGDIFDGLNLETVYLDGNNLRISDPLAENILNEHNLLVSGVIWHCNCEFFSKLVLKISEKDMREQQCYTDQSGEEVFIYWMRCNTMLKNNLLNKII